MAKVLITESILQDTADSIRSVKGTQGGITPSEFPSEIASMGGKFKPKYLSFYCADVTEADFTDFNNMLKNNIDTSELTSGYYMFNRIHNIATTRKVLDLSTFDTSNMTNMSYMFANNNYLSAVNTSSFDTSKVTNFSNMFYNNTWMDTFYVNGFDISKCSIFSAMFSNTVSNSICDVLDLSSWEFGNFESILCDNMFYMAKYLRAIYMDKLDLTKITSSLYMFRSLPSYCKIYVKNQACQNWILNLPTTSRNANWTTDNIIIAGSADDHRND